MQAIQLQWIDFTILIAYVAFVIGINLIWGAVLLVFGVFMLLGAIKCNQS